MFRLQEASYFPSVSVLSPESENRETLLLTVCLSSPGQTLAWGQHTGHTLDMALAGSNVYNTLVTWFLSLVCAAFHVKTMLIPCLILRSRIHLMLILAVFVNSSV